MHGDLSIKQNNQFDIKAIYTSTDMLQSSNEERILQKARNFFNILIKL